MAPTQDDRRQAEDALSFIRQTMESATTYTALSGWGVFAVGLIGIAASWIDFAIDPGATVPFRVWIPAALLGLAVTTVGTAWKSKKMDSPLLTGTFLKIAWGLGSALVAGAFLTLSLADEAKHLIPGMWLSVYGAGIVAGGIFSVPAIRAMGVGMLVLGGLALFTPAWGSYLLLAGFGGIHAVCGVYVAVKHGG